LDYKKIAYQSIIDRVTNKILIARTKEEYLKWGGFYEVFEIDDENIKKELLLSYAKNIIYQDIVPRYSIRNSEIVERLFFYLLSNAANLINYTTMAKTFDISDKTIKEYINYFEDVFLLKRIDKHHTKQKESIKSAKKIYSLDNGILQIAPKNSKNSGASLENWVFITLNRQDSNVCYLKETQEVDFYSNNILYQVAYNIQDDKTRKRELGAFEYFKNNLTQSILVTFDTNEYVDDVSIVSVDEFEFGHYL
jgi:predicted AAA+ superfamily ATPase